MSQEIPIPPRLRELIDERVFGFAQAAQKHYKTNDLVILLDLMEEKAELQALPRQELADSEEMPAFLRLQLSSPASQHSNALGSPNQSFWFVVIYESGEGDCVAINSTMLAPGGHA